MSAPTPSPLDELPRKLDLLARRGEHQLRSRRAREALMESTSGCGWWFVVGPSMAIVVQLHRLSAGADSIGLDLRWLIPLCFVPPLLFVALSWLRAAARPVRRHDALACIDQRLGEADRFIAADEFRHRGDPSPFMQAAIEDAMQRIDAALEQPLPLVPDQRPALPGDVRAMAATVALMLLAAFLDTVGGRGERDPSDGVPMVAEQVEVEEAERDDLRDPEQPAPEIEPTPAADREDRPPEPSLSARTHSSQLSDRQKQSRGKTQEGQSSDARSSSPGSDSRGAPTQQGQASKGSESPSKAKSQRKPPKPREDEKAPAKEQQEDPAGSTAGKGASRGSNRNPVSSDWSSRDQVSTPDDAELEDDGETEDEDEEQENRGGVQPNLRDRRPPVSRDLRIGFGNRPNPDANGRGGPSAAKKSRGVASLVLGVPIPDRVKGQPNAGKTKITQERIEPKAEEAEPGLAEARPPRGESFGTLRSAEMTPWLRDVVRRYFLQRRQEDALRARSTP